MARKKRATAKTSKAKKVAEMNQTHGKVDHQPTTLEEIWGEDGTSKYGTLNPEVYKEKLDGMTKSDIYLHASQMGIVPVDDTNRLKKTLMGLFNRHKAKFQVPPPQDETQPALPDKIKKILEEGK